MSKFELKSNVRKVFDHMYKLITWAWENKETYNVERVIQVDQSFPTVYG